MKLQRMIKKDQILTEVKFMSGRYWHGDVMSVDERVPMEFHLQDRCAKADPQTFPAVLKWSQHVNDLMVRIYMEYCEWILLLGAVINAQFAYIRKRPAW
jgi:hypothetical protein